MFDASTAPTSTQDEPRDDEHPPRGYQARKEAGWCTYGACPRRAAGWPEPTGQLCQRHGLSEAKRKAKWIATKRSEASAAGKCTKCGKPSKTYRCPGCRIDDGTTLPSMSVATEVATAPQQDQWRRDANGWKRYRGKGKRGTPKASVSDDSALQTAAAQLERGRIALAYARSPAVVKLGRISRDSARAAAAAVLAGAVRFVDDVVRSNMASAEWVPTRIAALRAALFEVLEDAERSADGGLVVDDALLELLVAAVVG